MRLVADSGLWSTGQQAAPTPLVCRAGSQWGRAVVDRRRPVDRRPDHVHRSGRRGLAVARPRRARAQRSGRGAGRTHAGGGHRTHRRRRAPGITRPAAAARPGALAAPVVARQPARRHRSPRRRAPRRRACRSHGARRGLLHRRHLRLRRGRPATPARRGAQRTPAGWRPAGDRTRADLRRARR